MARFGLSPQLIELDPSRGLEDACIVRCSVGDGPHTIYFHGHFDVVPAQDPASFTPSGAAAKSPGAAPPT
jgi:succinyl-diaminopimelate desuccinylase